MTTDRLALDRSCPFKDLMFSNTLACLRFLLLLILLIKNEIKKAVMYLKYPSYSVFAVFAADTKNVLTSP